MKKILVAILAVAVGLMFVSSSAFAAKKYAPPKAAAEATQAPQPEALSVDAVVKDSGATQVEEKSLRPTFPEKGWHKGPYLAANIGLVQVSNDKHIITGRPFGSWANLGFGITFGWDITDWIGPMLQINFSTKTAQVGDANGGNNGGAPYPSQPDYIFPAGTFPEENARQWQTDIGIFAKATLPYFTRASWQPDIVKIIPYAKLGGAANGVYVNANTAADKSGAFGGGPALGVGCEFFIWKGIFVALDFTEYLIFQQSISKNIDAAPATGGAAVSTKFNLTEGGFKPHFSLMGLIGWHF